MQGLVILNIKPLRFPASQVGPPPLRYWHALASGVVASSVDGCEIMKATAKFCTLIVSAMLYGNTHNCSSITDVPATVGSGTLGTSSHAEANSVSFSQSVHTARR